MSYQGYFDQVDSNGVVGWVRDPNNPDDKVTVEILLDGIPCGEGVANHHRVDLENSGIGDGKHGFYVDFEKGPLYGDGERKVEIRVKNTEHLLDGGPLNVKPSRYAYIAMDLVDNCNLRCPFCLYDYSHTKRTHRMAQEVFEKLLQLIPHVPKGGFWMSCLHEPSLHPEFLDFIDLVPEQFRKKVFFTSNFARKLNDEYFERLADSNIHHINISVDSLHPELYPVLRKGSKLELLLDNLTKLRAAFDKNSRAPYIRFITMVFKSNFDELTNIVNHCHSEYRSMEHELRYPFKVPHITDEFRENHFLENERWTDVDELTKTMPGRIVFEMPEDNYAERVFDAVEHYLDRDPYNPTVIPHVPSKPLGFRFSANGDGRIEGYEEHFHINARLVDNIHQLLNAL